MRLLIVTNDAWFLVSHRLGIVEAAVAAGHGVTVAARGDASVERIRAAGAEFTAWAVEPRGTSVVDELWAMASLGGLIRHVRPDVVHLVTIKPVLYGGAVSRVLRVPGVVYAIAGLGGVVDARNTRARFIRYVVRNLYAFAIGHPNGVVVFQNAHDRQALVDWLHLPHLETELVRGSGVDPDAYRVVPEPPGTPRVLLPARLLRDKGIEEFVLAARALRADGIDATFLVAGGDAGAGNPAAFGPDELERLGADGAVTFLGHRTNMPTLLESVHLVVLPSWREGLPRALVEAGAAGRAVVTTDVPGCRDAIDPGVTGLLVPLRDPDALARAIRTLLEDPDRRGAMGRAGRALVEREMRADAVAARHLSIYERLHEARRGTVRART